MDRLFDDLLQGAAEISEEVLGNASEKNKRRIYHAYEKGHLPIFEYLGGLAARRSTLRQHIADKERAAASAKNVKPENPDTEAREGRDALAKRSRRMRTRTKHRAATDAALTD